MQNTQSDQDLITGTFNITSEINNLLAQIAKSEMRINTLETQKRDGLDYHDVAVWALKAALQKAFVAGVNHAANNK